MSKAEIAPAPAPAPAHDGHDRIIVHIDYDCFYASVIENERPELRALPLGIQQKNILATCNYVARARGVKKLQLISEAKKACPDLIIVNGEDLSRFRDASKKLWLYVRDFIWGHTTERLGFDEVFLDVTPMIDFNLALFDVGDFPASATTSSSLSAPPRLSSSFALPASATQRAKTSSTSSSKNGYSNTTILTENEDDQKNRKLGYFRLSKEDPAKGFLFRWNHLPAHTYPSSDTIDLQPEIQDHSGDSLEYSQCSTSDNPSSHLYKRLFLAVHLSHYLRTQIHNIFNYTSSAGISTSKLTSKLVGSVNKPNKQTLLIPSATQHFLDTHEIGKVPGIGYKTAQVLRGEVLGLPNLASAGLNAEEIYSGKIRTPVSVYDARQKLNLESICRAIGSRDLAGRIWGWLHGIDRSAVSQASVVPSQISIEDTFKGLHVGTKKGEIEKVLLGLVGKLVGRMLKDLVDGDEDGSGGSGRRWIAYPRTFRLSIRPRDAMVQWGARISRSTALPRYVFSIGSAKGMSMQTVVERLVREVAVPLLRRTCVGLGGEGGVVLQLVNVAVVNMGDGEVGPMGDVREMLRGGKKRRREEEEEEEEEVKGESSTIFGGDWDRGSGNEMWSRSDGSDDDDDRDEDLSGDSGDGDEDMQMTMGGSLGGDGVDCPRCGAWVMMFAVEAHARFHEMEDVEGQQHTIG
ncbi:hypothetical protein BDZ91DRAFT_763353 [Kalaharituber pfeilii]|nr:hypothetical protein BDZ91DRAFT_763353 [Kalaharituber pfeilii]